MLSQWMPSWQGITSGSSSATSSRSLSKGGGSSRTRASSATSTGVGGSRTTAQEEADDDKLADELMSQFPAYGSHQQQQHPQQDWLLMGYPVVTTSMTMNDTTTAAATSEQKQQTSFMDDGDSFHHGINLFSDHAILTGTGTSAAASSSIVGGGGGGSGNTTKATAASSASASGSTGTGGNSRSGGDKQQQPQKQPQSNALISPSTEDWDYEERFLWKTTATTALIGDDNQSKSKPQQPQDATRKNHTDNVRQRHEWIHGTHKMETTSTTTNDVTFTPNPQASASNSSSHTPQQTPTSAYSSSRRHYFSTLTSPILLSKIHNNSNTNNEQQQQDPDNSNMMDDPRQHWMPDQLCKQCYSCETTFTVFRRRHHCRLCGQVFCNMCSAYFLPHQQQQQHQQPQANNSTIAAAATAAAATGTPSATASALSSSSTSTSIGSTTTIRVCRTCHEQVTQRGGLLLEGSSSLIHSSGGGGIETTITTTAASNTADNSNVKTATTTILAGAVVVASTPNNNNSKMDPLLLSSPTTTSGKSPSAILTGDDKNNVFDSPDATTTRSSSSMTTSSLRGELSVLQGLSKRRLLLLPDLGATTASSASSSSLLLLQEQQQQQQQQLQAESQRQEQVAAEGGGGRRMSSSFSNKTNQEAPVLASSLAAAAATASQQQQQEPLPPPQGNTSSSNTESNRRNDKNNSKMADSGADAATTTTTTTIVAADAATASTKGNESVSSATQMVREGNRHLGMTAASHLEHMARELLRQHAPLLWNSLSKKKDKEKENNHGDNNIEDKNIVNAVDNKNEENQTMAPDTGNEEYEDTDGGDIEGDAMKAHWINQLLTLATRCCATVDPNVKNGDLLDIRPYCKVKVIPGGSYRDCAYMSGVLFRKTVSHKRMAKELENPRIMLLSGGIEFTRNENRIASLETLFEQEGKYTEILVGKILKLKPDVLMAGRSVSRRAQELLLKAGVVLIQHVKSKLLSRISRQTGARIISGSDHVMSQFNASILGKCHRFRLATFRDNEVWVDQIMETTAANGVCQPVATDGAINSTGTSCTTCKRCIPTLLANPNLKNHERQAALAASKLGQGVLDGAEAVRSGLAKRGVAQTYVMLEGCPKNLGCTVVLRGADRAALKQVKTVLRFLIATAYNLRLETSYFKERGARIRPDFEVETKHTFSTSLCVEFGTPPAGRKIRPWNGSETAPESETGDITAFDHQSILVTSVWMTDKSQCCPAEVKGICYYSMQDVALGQFLRDSCFNLSLKCQNPNCKKTVIDHSLSFVHNDGLINIVVEEMDEELPPSPNDPTSEDDDRTRKSEADDADGEIDKPIATWTYCRKCDKLVAPLGYISEKTWKFSFGKFLETFFYNRDAILNAPELGCSCQLQSSAIVYFGCGKIAARFVYEPVRPFDVFVRRSLPIDLSFHRTEARKRLEQISMASSTLFVKFDKHIERVTREARSLFNSAVNRPEHLQTVLSELNRIGSEVDHAAKTLQEKIASLSDECRRRDDEAVVEALLRFPWFARRYLFMLTSAWNEKLSATGVAITAMKKLASAAAVRGDGGLAPNVSVSTVVGDPYSDELLEGMKRLLVLNERYSTYNVTDINQALPALPGGSQHLPQEDFDDDFDEAETSIDFSDGVDADVLASRRRLQHTKPNLPQDRKPRVMPTKTLGAMKAVDGTRSSQETSPVSVAPKPTPGGAVKSAFNRLFNRGGREQDAYVVDLGIFADGRPRLEPGVKGIVLPVVDEQWSSVIAYSLASTEYAKQFKHFSKFHVSNMSADPMLISPTSIGSVDGSSLESTIFDPTSGQDWNESRTTERRMLFRNKTHIKHTFRDFDEKGHVTCKFVCTTYWATQFHAVRQIFLSNNSTGIGEDADLLSSPGAVEQSYIESLSSAYSWAASGGKSGASFSRTSDDRFVCKCISRTELQMFLDCAPAYFEYLSKAFFHGLPTVLCKIVGVYQIGVHNRETGKRSMEQVAVMQNIFYNRKITKIFDLKGSLRGRFAAQSQSAKDDSQPDTPSMSDNSGGRRKEQWDDGKNRNHDSTTPDNMSDESGAEQGSTEKGGGTLLDGDFLEFTQGRPVALTDRAKAVFQMSILNDTLFLSIINVLDYSILVGVDEENMELVVGIIDFMRQYDILKQMERVGKSLPMVVGSEAPTIIQPPLYKSRFTNAMERYFMTVPSKWTQI